MIQRVSRDEPSDTPQPAVVVPLTEPHRDWDDDPRTCAREDDRYWDDLYDRDED